MGCPDDDGRLEAALLEALADALVVQRLTDPQRRGLRERVLAAAARSAPKLGQALEVAAARRQRAWWHGAGLRVLRRGIWANQQIAVVRLDPGGRVAGRTRAREEECFILEGEVLIGSLRLRQGESHVAHAGCHRRDITSPTGALLMVRCEIRSPA
jgi:hypothetical protein